MKLIPAKFSDLLYLTLATAKGYVDIRGVGESNGYYSESVDFVRVIRGGGKNDR